MLCSAAEMGYEDKVINTLIRDGIWILDDSITPGTDISEALELKDHVVDFEITPNRPDCLSMIGMAREAGGGLRHRAELSGYFCEGNGGRCKRLCGSGDKEAGSLSSLYSSRNHRYQGGAVPLVDAETPHARRYASDQ